MNNKLEKKFIIKVPNDVEVYYHSKKSFIFFKSSITKKRLKSNFNLLLLKNKNNSCYLYVTNEELDGIENKKKLSRKLITSKIKTFLLELVSKICIKLKLIGVGYKISKLKNSNLLHFKLGYSHDLFFKYPSFFNVNVLRKNIIYVSGSSLKNLSTFASILRSYKVPEPYKGKGLLFLNEKIKLKIGKKV